MDGVGHCLLGSDLEEPVLLRSIPFFFVHLSQTCLFSARACCARCSTSFSSVVARRLAVCFFLDTTNPISFRSCFCAGIVAAMTCLQSHAQC